MEWNMACGHPSLWIAPATATAIALVEHSLQGWIHHHPDLLRIIDQAREACKKSYDADQDDYDEERTWWDQRTLRDGQRRVWEAFRVLDPLDNLLENIQ
jgi:hypothetical protein